MTDRALSLSEAADRLGWSRRTLTRKLKEQSIATFGRGRLERIEPADLEILKAKERQCREATTASSRPESAGSGISGGRSVVNAMKSARARRIARALRSGQRNTMPTSSVTPFPTPGTR